MARSPRLYIPGAVYHVYCRTARGEMVFSNENESMLFVETVEDVKRLHGFAILAWCLLGNHYHIVIKTKDTLLWRSMARIQCRIAREHNRRKRVLGRLWQSRYKARIVLDEVYYKQLLAYVHLNPVAAGIVDDPSRYRWCGHSALLGNKLPRLVDVDDALRGFGETLGEARQAYLDQVRLVAEERWLVAGVRNLSWWENVANDEQILQTPSAVDAFDYSDRFVPGTTKQHPRLLDIAREVSHKFGVSIEAMQGYSRSTTVASARRQFAVVAVEQFAHTVQKVALFLRKHPGSVSRWLETPSRSGGRIINHCGVS